MPWTTDLQELETKFRRRLLAVYIVGVLVLTVTVGTLQWFNIQREEANAAFRHQLVDVCYISRENTINLNSAVDQIVASVRTSKALTAAEKAQRIEFYKKVRGEVPTCPPR